MLVLITGSRDYSDSEKIESALRSLPPGAHTLINGDCSGADRIASAVAQRLGSSPDSKQSFKIITIPADWKLGRKAGPLRNTQMLNLGPELILVAHPAGKGCLNIPHSGTADTVRKALERGWAGRLVFIG